MAGPLNVGLVGVGQRGLQHVELLSRLQDEEEVRLAALADPFTDNLEESKIQTRAPSYRQRDTKLFASVDEMLDGADLDAVWFVMPPNQHKQEIVRAAQRGVHIMAEKPQSLFYDEALEMAEAIDKAGVISTVGFQMRHDDWYTKLTDYTSDKHVASVMMVNVGGVEGHGVKHTHTEELGGPANRVWTANRAWSGSSVVEAGIHQTDLMRYWSHDDIDWVQASYVERDPSLHAQEGDNPIAYTVVYGFKRGGVGNLVLARPARVYYGERYDYVLTTHAMVKFEDDMAVYSYTGDDYPPKERPSQDDVRRVLAKGPHENAMGSHNTYELDRSFVRAVAENNPTHLKNTFESSLNSLCAVLAANISHDLGERIYLDEFATSGRFAQYRRKS